LLLEAQVFEAAVVDKNLFKVTLKGTDKSASFIKTDVFQLPPSLIQ
jgi:hypothetical protein